MLSCQSFLFFYSFILLFFTAACSKEETEAGEFANWQERNEAYFATLEDSLSQASAQWLKIKNYSLDQSVEILGPSSDYIYVKVIDSGTETASPAYTDSVRVMYRGRLIPSVTYPAGYVFDSTVNGNFDIATGSTAKMLVSTLVDGFSTALQHMHRGDRWRVYIPYQLGYGSTGNSGSVPGYSTLIFDLQLLDFSHAGEAMPVWN